MLGVWRAVACLVLFCGVLVVLMGSPACGRVIALDEGDEQPPDALAPDVFAPEGGTVEADADAASALHDAGDSGTCRTRSHDTFEGTWSRTENWPRDGVQGATYQIDTADPRVGAAGLRFSASGQGSAYLVRELGGTCILQIDFWFRRRTTVTDDTVFLRAGMPGSSIALSFRGATLQVALGDVPVVWIGGLRVDEWQRLHLAYDSATGVVTVSLDGVPAIVPGTLAGVVKDLSLGLVQTSGAEELIIDEVVVE